MPYLRIARSRENPATIDDETIQFAQGVAAANTRPTSAELKALCRFSTRSNSGLANGSGSTSVRRASTARTPSGSSRCRTRTRLVGILGNRDAVGPVIAERQEALAASGADVQDGRGAV